jgi:AcrR family transcriptional regulator
MQNVAAEPDVATRIASATATRKRRPDYPSEVRALLDAANEVIATTGKARVADIVRQAGLSNDAFYRHFASKDALVAAIIEDGAERAAERTARHMAEVASPEAKVRCWLDDMLARARGTSAAATRSVLAINSSANSGIATGDHAARQPFAELLREPFAALGSTYPELDAELVAHAVTNRIAGHIRAGTSPSRREVQHLRRFCLSTAQNGANP